IGRIGNQPRLTAFHEVEIVLPEMLGRMKRSLKRFDGLVLDLLLDGSQLRALDVLEFPPCELIRPLERRAVFTQVRERALQIRISPRRTRGRPLLCRRRSALWCLSRNRSGYGNECERAH